MHSTGDCIMCLRARCFYTVIPPLTSITAPLM
jgi:hypothetical protein